MKDLQVIYDELGHEDFMLALLDVVMVNDDLEPGRRLDLWRLLHPEGPISRPELADALGVKLFSVERWTRYRRGEDVTNSGMPMVRNRKTIEEEIGIPAVDWDPRAVE